jgi:hypothetical protein
LPCLMLPEFQHTRWIAAYNRIDAEEKEKCKAKRTAKQTKAKDRQATAVRGCVPVPCRRGFAPQVPKQRNVDVGVEGPVWNGLATARLDRAAARPTPRLARPR